VSEDEIEDLIGEFVVNGYRFKVVTSKVVDMDDRIDVIYAGGSFRTNVFLAVSVEQYKEIKAADEVENFMELLRNLAPQIIGDETE